jgi:hypothetical protein
MDVTTVNVYPEEGRFPEIARALLEAAGHPRQVVSVSHPRAGFVVPEDVFERFEAAQANVEPDPGGAVEDVPRKRRPGRPRKNAEPDVSKEQ